MNCIEVTELMQRYLDEDLNETENNDLQRHLTHCVQCTEMFERLQRLSDDLANLPKVTPPHSIVDSIMPQLEQLDRTIQRKLSRPVSWKWFGGVVAAGLLLGVFIFNPPFMSERNAGEIANDSSEQQTMQIQTFSGGAESDPSVNSNDVGIMGITTFTEAEDKQPPNLDEQNNRALLTQEMPDTTNHPETREERMPEDAFSSAGHVGEEPVNVIDQHGTLQEVAHLLEVTPTSQLLSPTGQYLAIVDNGQVMISNTSDQSTIYRSIFVWEDSVELLEWTDERYLVYEVHLANSTKQLIIDVDNKSEETQTN